MSTFNPNLDERYTPELHMVWELFNGPGYHSKVAKGAKVHPTRESMDYALGLLASGEEARVERAGEVIRRVLSLQDQDPTSPTYGIWSWLLEESLKEMAPPDWNWADFIGIRLCKILVNYRERLSLDLVQATRTALGHAGWSIFRRNAAPGYTNIAIMGAAVTLSAGELLSDSRLLDYGRRRLRRMLEYTESAGEFEEYNSPQYTVLALDECENILDLVRDPEAAADAEALRRIAWRTIAEHFHPGTQQWAGPHSRNYHDLLSAGVVEGLLARPRACPPDLRKRFERLPDKEVFLRRRFVRRDDESESVWGSTWLSKEACLGSANHDILWHQRRPLIGYWRSGDGGVAVLRARFFHDGRDFASAYATSAQVDWRVLSSFRLVSGYGDFHPSLDRPADGAFAGADFRLRYELTASDARVTDLGGRRFALAAGNRKAVLHTLPAEFDGAAVEWTMGQEGETVFVDAVCYTGAIRIVEPDGIGATYLAAGLELLPADEAPSLGPVLTRGALGSFEVDWPVAEGLSVVEG